jgi:pimeloyl-ACP methyl ester carboxylesterase
VINSGYRNIDNHQIYCFEYTESGAPLVLLHGGLGASEDFAPYFLPTLADNFHIYAYDRSAHGRTGIRPGFYHFAFQADEAIAYLESLDQAPAHLLGWSDGGIIALLVAIKRPDLVASIVAIGTNFHHDCGIAFQEPDEIVISPEDAEIFAERSPDPAHVQAQVIRKAFQIWASEPNMTTADLALITCPVLVLAGDDEVFDNQHTLELYEALADGRLAIIPGASHYVVKERTELMLTMIKDFYAHPEFPLTKYPRRRRGKGQVQVAD